MNTTNSEESLVEEAASFVMPIEHVQEVSVGLRTLDQVQDVPLKSLSATQRVLHRETQLWLERNSRF